MIEKVLIANRGEIALRVIKTCKALGIKTVAVYSDEDRNSLHVKNATEAYHIGEAAPAKSYLNQEKILEVMLSSGTDAVHPGYGFLSENDDFARLCEKNKINFIGPSADSMNLCGDKMRCKEAMLKAKVPTVPGSPGLVKDADEAEKIANEININLNSKDNVKFLMVEENGVGPKYLFSGEKLSPVLTVYKADDFNHAKSISNEILNYQGIGHSIGIHTNKNERIMQLGLDLPVCRVIVNQAHAFATGGSFANGLPFSLSMGCGTWQKNTIDNNLNYKHFINTTKISTTIKGNEPKLKDFFEEYCQKYHKEEIKNLD